jgi:uncharacterized membrane protein
MRFQHGGFSSGFGGHGFGLFAILLMIVFWAVVVLLVITLFRNYRRGPHHLHDHGHGHGPGHGPGPLDAQTNMNPAIDILKERFAKGEVSEEEFTRRLVLLKES